MSQPAYGPILTISRFALRGYHGWKTADLVTGPRFFMPCARCRSAGPTADLLKAYFVLLFYILCKDGCFSKARIAGLLFLVLCLFVKSFFSLGAVRSNSFDAHHTVNN